MLAFKGLLKASSGMQFALLKNGPNRLASLSLPFICLALKHDVRKKEAKWPQKRG